MKSYIQFLTSPTADTPGTTLILVFDNKRYIIGNVCEGTQRAAMQMGARLLKVTDLLITGRTEWSNLGGLIGMVLTLADSNASAAAAMLETYEQKLARGQNAARPEPSSLHMYGAPNLNHLLGTCRRYVFRKGMPIVATEYVDQKSKKDDQGEILPAWQDDFIRVWALAVAPAKNYSNVQDKFVQELKKQAFDKTNGFEDQTAPENETAEEREARYSRIRKSVVRHMFDSDWSFDTLVETHITKAEMPATLYTRNSETKQLELYRGPMPGGDRPLPDITVLTRKPWPGALLQALPPTEPAPEAISYILCNHPQRGKFDATRANELEVPKGPKWGALTRGESVENIRGQTVTPEMVLGEGRLGSGVAIIDLPSIDYVEPLINREEWSSDNVMQGIEAFVWILGPGVAEHPLLRQFMQKTQHVKHIVSSLDYCANRLSLDSAAASTIRLAQVDFDRYGVPFHDNITLPQEKFNISTVANASLPPEIIPANRGLKINLEPTFEVQKDSIISPLDTTAVLKGTPQEVIHLAKAAQDAIQNDKEALEAWKRKIPCPDAEIITLGTGSALPSKYRNVSATLLRVPGIGSYLFDCGENTLGQLQRVYNPKELCSVFRDLRMIWISHLHADHHLGTASVIKAWYSVVCNKNPLSGHNSFPSSGSGIEPALAVISDEGMLKWLHEYSSVEDFGYSRILPLSISPAVPKFSVASTLELFPPPRRPTYDGEFLVKKDRYHSLFGLQDVQAVNVKHCWGAKAVTLTFPQSTSGSGVGEDPLKVSYSGDCRPSHEFAHIGQGTTVLIHEATFDDELKGDAMAKKHSTTSEALDVGVRMGAKAVVLTHFSQRYQKIPVLETVEGDESKDDVAVGGISDDDVDDPVKDIVEPNDPEGIVKSLDAEESSKAQYMPANEQVIRVRSKDMKVAIAFDYMKVKIGEIAQLEKFNPALSKLFEVDKNEYDDVTEEGKKGKKNGHKDGDDERGKKKKARRNN